MAGPATQQFSSLRACLRAGRPHGPVALIFAEDSVALDSTLRHHLKLGFASVLLFGAPHLSVPEDIATRVRHVLLELPDAAAVTAHVNAVLRALPGVWVYYGYNAEYLYFPFCETRHVGDMLAFQQEERRDGVFCTLVDLYAADLETCPSGVCLEAPHLDTEGYFALPRPNPEDGSPRLDRQIALYGGLRWRFEEHTHHTRRRVDRVALVRAQPGLALGRDGWFTREDVNTHAAAWHRSLTGAVVSFRAAKGLRHNPGARAAISSFMWQHSVRFTWQSQQLMELGFMEPGQWF